MKIVIGYPPLDSALGFPLLGQNRQFQWVHSPWTAYPLVPASAATLLKKNGYEVLWLDGINSFQTYLDWEKDLLKTKADFLMMESKTPVIKKHWQVINRLKEKNPKLKIILVGDHVTTLPLESFKKSKVDYILTGGDYDFLILNLLNHLTKKEPLEPGIYFRSHNLIKNTGQFKLDHDLNKLPFIDRDLTCWQLYAYKNSNYKNLPGTYTMFSRDCWWHRCTFCSWTTLYPAYRTIKPSKALAEIAELIEKYQIKEIMDDSGTFPNGEWLKEFCYGMIQKKYHQKIKINCNLRFNAGLNKKDYQLMAKAGFRFLLFGLESANQKTLNRLRKNLNISLVEKNLSWIKEAGLEPHLTVMVGYPWEKKEDILSTLVFVKKLIKKGLIASLQATLVIPYPGTQLFEEAQKNKWLRTKNWEKYDMRQPVLKTSLTNKELKELIQNFYKAVLVPNFLFKKIYEAFTSFDTLKYYFRLALKLPSKLLDFH